MKLKDKVVFITGSTLHTGYGIAQHCLLEGAMVVVNGIKREEVASAADQLREETNGKVIEAYGDISKENEVIR
ncbi:MAG: SDR family NAD(P)-dependent oxidoreductase, partial [Mameliella sp.]|nr:SDR family NAD(P)-dependent oxidoreductase [Phaeodactylibacter sp.]